MQHLQNSFVTVKEIEAMTAIPAYTIRKLVRKGIIPAYKVGRSFLFRPEEVSEAIIKHKVN